MKARLDPLGIQQPRAVPELDPSLYGLDGSAEVNTEGILTLPGGRTRATVDEIRSHLEATYCDTIAVEAEYIRNREEAEWLAKAVESIDRKTYFSAAEKRNIHSLLVQSEMFDHFMHVKFGSFKRYGLEGAESMLPAVQAILETSGKQGVERVVLGMPHRGRLNLLVALLGYPARALFCKVKGGTDVPEGMQSHDDVVSHIAHTAKKRFGERDVTVSLLHNPSHLEAINPVAQGKTRAKQDDTDDVVGDQTMCLQLHGDAAFAGQGVVPESLMLSRLPGFTVGGTVHLIVNNQIGYTTLPDRSRSSLYSSDMGRMIDAPVLHVNADDPEATVVAARIAVEYRQKFKKDIIIDLIGYRKHGHNEVDEPSFTQPLMYQNIRSRKSAVKLYEERLMSQGLITEASIQKIAARVTQHLESELAASNDFKASSDDHFQGKWKGYGQPTSTNDVVDTGVPLDRLKRAGIASVTVPTAQQGFTVHPRLQRMHIEPRIAAIETGKSIDWATAEAMAFGTLLEDGFGVRIAGQDVERGTFSQRHCVFTDQKNNSPYMPFGHAGYKGRFRPVNSNLSEEAVIGFEVGYNWESPRNLNIWEAQFGDFWNGAQIMIDTFVSSSESKWLRAQGLVLLLPHGYDGAGPEHSSGRVERLLQNVDSEPSSPASHPVNMIIANCTTPANYFHILRRQMLRKYRRPLILMAPKTLLRHGKAVSALADMGPGSLFQPVIADNAVPAGGVKTVVFCSGKLYYDLIALREQLGRTDLAFVRLEELAPFPVDALRAEIAKYTKANKFVWAQEEPSNAGPWTYVQPRLNLLLGKPLDYIGRPALPSPAVGSGVAHKAQYDQLVAAIKKL